jgi:YD repeat-containing protein
MEEIGMHTHRISLLFALASLVLLLSLTGCGDTAAPAAAASTAASASGDTWQEQYDLGMKYLEDGNYQEAVTAFEAAISIDPKQAPAYLGLAEVYIAQNDFGKAAEILQQGIDATGDESLQKRLEEINSGNISDYWGNQRKRSGYDAGGALQWYHVMDYKDERETRCTSYDAAGTQIGQVEVLYDEQGNRVQDYAYNGDGELFPYKNTYDAQGRCTKSIHYRADGTVSGYCTYENDAQGHRTKETWYDPDGTLTGYWVYEYDAQGRLTKYTSYNADGTVTGYETNEYDAQGNCTKDTSHNADGTVTGYHTYEYDAQGHRTKSTWYNADGTVKKVTTYD